MKNILVKINEDLKVNKKKIIKVTVTLVVLGVVSVGILGGVFYSYAKSNVKYTQKQAEEIALNKIPGEIIKAHKEIDFEDATLEYEFEIKDKENMLKKITVSSKSGAITDMEDEYRNID